MTRIDFKTIRQNLKDTPNIFVAVSGGLDSMVLLDVIDRCFGSDEKTHIYCCYFEHNPSDPRGEHAFIQGAIRKKYPNVNFLRGAFSSDITVGDGSFESKARTQRYNWLTEMCSKTIRTKALLTAHHLDDDIETILFNILTNRSFGGIRADFEWNGTDIHRPFLDYTKLDLTDYAENFGVTWKEDPTNADVSYCDRNFIRNDLLPRIIGRFGKQGHLLRLKGLTP